MDSTSSPKERKYPWESRMASNKWHFLFCQGYVSDRRTPDDTGLVFYRQDEPRDWGTITWWGKVTWGGL